VSEYQYYDFKAIDHALTKTEMVALRAISTRAVITTTSFTNHHEWGDLKADPLKVLEKYFDAFVYVANWGTREFHLRLPQELADLKRLKSILPGKAARVRSAGKFVIVSFESEVEPDDDWDDGTGWMGSLMSLRADLLRGDLRCLYLGWLVRAPRAALTCFRSTPITRLADVSSSRNSRAPTALNMAWRSSGNWLPVDRRIRKRFLEVQS
jgi:hypothetical protein